MPHIIRLPEPCHEDWNAMTPAARGRHCAQCAKTVVDFTGWAPQEILFYLQTNTGACGRFRADQLNVPLPSPEDFVREIVQLPFSFMKRVAAIFLFVFGLMAGTSCTQPNSAAHQAVEAKITNQDTFSGAATGAVSIALPDDTTTTPLQQNKANKKGKQQPTPQVLGEPAIIEQPEVMGGAPVVEVIPQPVAVPANDTAHQPDIIDIPDNAIIISDSARRHSRRH